MKLIENKKNKIPSRFGGTRASKGKIVKYPNNPEYFGYSQPLRHKDALHFCNSFRGNIIVPRTDEEMKLVQFLGRKIIHEFEKKEPKVDREFDEIERVLYRTLWLGIRFNHFQWISYATNIQVISNYWADPKRANLINIVKVELPGIFSTDTRASVNHRISIYSSSQWFETPEELLNVICINTTEMSDLQTFGKLTFSVDNSFYSQRQYCHRKRTFKS